MSLAWRVAFWATILGAAFQQAALAADMADVRRAMAEHRYFDAFTDLQDLATGGDPEAQFELAGFHHYGRVGPTNYEKAFNWYSRSANQGNADAMIGLAVIYGQGQGTARDPKMAYQWLATASLQSLPKDASQRVASAMDSLRAELGASQIEAAEAAAMTFKAVME